MRKLLILMTICGLLAAFISADEPKVGTIKPQPVELIERRTERSETFDTHDGKRQMNLYLKKRFYKDGDVYKKIDLSSSKEVKDTFTDVVNSGIYTYRYDSEDKNKGYRFEHDSYYVTYIPTGNLKGKTTEVTPRADGVKEIITLTSDADSSLSWSIDTNAYVSFSEGELTFRDSTGTFLFRVPKPWAQDATRNPVAIITGYSHNILTYDLVIPDAVSWPVAVDPSTVLGETDSSTGRLLSINDGNYLSSRNSTAAGGPGGGVFSENIIVGQRLSGTLYFVDRSSLLFDTSALPDDATIDSAKVVIVVENIYTSGSDYILNLVEGTYTGSFSAGWFNDFTGWASSGTYSIPALANTYATSSFSVGDSLFFTLNSTGISAISTTGNTPYMLLSDRDINATAPTSEEQIIYQDNSPYIQIWYTEVAVDPPSNFTMSALTTTSIACSWNDNSDNETAFFILNWADSTVVDSLVANAVADTVTGLSENTHYIWMAAAADSSGSRAYSAPDSAYTLITLPVSGDISIMPISSDTLRIVVTAPQNGTSGITGMDVDAISGTGATDSGWLTGEYTYLDGGLDPDEDYSYRVRFRNGDGQVTNWSPTVNYSMKGLDSLIVNLTGDLFDDYNVDAGSGRRDSTVVRTGTSGSGEQLDGFVSFSIPWFVVNGGVDSLFLSMTRNGEESSDTPSITLYGIPVKHDDPIEERSLGSLGSTSATASWTISSGTGSRTSPDLRSVFREWQDIAASVKDFSYDFGVRLDDSSQSTGEYAVFLDYSNPSYSNSTSLKIYYTPGYSDSLENAPDNFSLSVLAPDSLSVSWSDNSDSEYGFVILNLSDSTMAAGTDSLPQNTTSVDTGNLTPNTEYVWFVRAYTAEDFISSGSDTARTTARVPGTTTVSSLTESSISFIIDPQDNPGDTQFAVQDSVTGLYVDGSAEPDTLKAGSAGEWSWKTYAQWGAALGDTLTGLMPDSLYVIRAKARSNE